MNRAQMTMTDEIIVDNFAGGGGASTGIELASGRVVNIAINHDRDAILMHRTNHPYTEHYQASVWDVDPREVCKGRPVGLAWFSPDCKHFSKAKGAALVDKNIRGLAWIVLRWAALVRPRVIMLENVEEFQTWGPVRKGKPIKKKAGQTFRKFIQQLKDLGYVVEHRELIAADYGAPTTRKRFVLVARCDGNAISWPEPTHAPRDSEAVKSGRLLPWRSAAEIIDWSLPCPSVFASKKEIRERYGVNSVRPLAKNTLRRVIRGVDKFTIKSGEPFIVPIGYGEREGQMPRVHDLKEPLPTVVGTGKQNLCSPVFAPFTFSNTGESVGAAAKAPVHTIRAAGGQILAGGLLTPCILHAKFNNGPQTVCRPISTITAVGAHEICTAQMIQYHTEQTESVRANSVAEPAQTLDTSNRYGLAAAHLTEYYGNGQPVDIRDPMRTATSHDREALTTVHVAEFKGQDIGQSLNKPLRTITTSAGEFALICTKIARYKAGTELGFWPQIRDLLNEHCGYVLKEDEVLLLNFFGVWFFISDIGLRMLNPRELYNAMGFPADYIIDRDYMGNEYGKTKQVARCGNAVCPPLAEAMVRANLPEWCSRKIGTMAEVADAVAV